MEKVPNCVQCKPWCMSLLTGPPLNCGGECMADGTQIGATFGPIVMTDTGAKIARVETNAAVGERGDVGVHLSIHGPINSDPMDADADRAAWATLSPAEARRLADAILVEADRAEGLND
jgi:hypothetical protein